MNAKELKRNLRILKQTRAELEETTFVSRRLRQILKNGDKDNNRISFDIDTDSYIKDNLWGKVKRIIKSKANTYRPLLKLSAFCILETLSLP